MTRTCSLPDDERFPLLTAEGRRALDAWLDALTRLRDELTEFLERGRKGGDDVREASPQAGVARSEP